MSTGSTMPLSTANWHWKNKNVTAWARQWLEDNLAPISVVVPLNDQNVEVKVSKLFSVEGDVELGQRKSKLITIYDLRLIIDLVITSQSSTVAKGRIHIPEVSHEITCDGLGEYTYMYDQLTPTPPSDDTQSTLTQPSLTKILTAIKKEYPPLLEAVFALFPGEIIAIHGKDLTVSADASRVGTPVPGGAGSAGANSGVGAGAGAAAKKAEASTAGTAKKVAAELGNLNTTTLSTSANFQASSADLFSLLTDPGRLPSWTRAVATSNPKVGGEYSLFGGNIKGRYISLDEGKEIKQTWRLEGGRWPDGHFATLTTTLTQSSDSTELTLTLEGVPTGMEEEVRRGLEGYYIHGFKSIGYVQLYPYYPTAPASTHKRPTKTKASEDGGRNTTLVILIAALVLLGAFAIPFVGSGSPPMAKPTS